MFTHDPSRRRLTRVIALAFLISWLLLMWCTWFRTTSAATIPDGMLNIGTTETREIGLFHCRTEWENTIENTKYGGTESFRAVQWRPAGTFQSIAFTAISAIVFWIVPIFLLRDRTRPGQCIECGYDLRGTTTNQCPECGAIDSRKA